MEASEGHGVLTRGQAIGPQPGTECCPGNSLGRHVNTVLSRGQGWRKASGSQGRVGAGEWGRVGVWGMNWMGGCRREREMLQVCREEATTSSRVGTRKCGTRTLYKETLL